MRNTEIRSEEIRVQGLLDGLLNQRFRDSGAGHESHLEEDSLTAFVEGNLNEREAEPIVAHLVDCSFCLHVTSELVKLDLAFVDEPVAPPVVEGQPTKVSEVLNGLFSRIFGTGDGVVFAHQESEEESVEENEGEESAETKK